VKVNQVHAEVAEHCSQIAHLFKPGARVTVLIRNPGLGDGDMVVTDDSLDAAIAALENLKGKEERKLTASDFL
jgi:hypothetical protein